MPVTEEEDRAASASAKVAELEQRQADLVSCLKHLDQEAARLATQTQFLGDFSDNLISSGETSDCAALVDQTTVGQ